jgi:hypothetical protein
MGVYVGGESVNYPIPVSKGGTGAISFTQGSVIFMGTSTLTENNSNFFWDNVNNRLGIWTNTPIYSIQVNYGDVWTVGSSGEGTFHWGNPNRNPPSTQDDVPKDHFGSNKFWLGEPLTWALIRIQGVDYIIPAYSPE